MMPAHAVREHVKASQCFCSLFRAAQTTQLSNPWQECPDWVNDMSGLCNILERGDAWCNG